MADGTAEGLPFHAVSAVTGLGLSDLVRDVAARQASERPMSPEGEEARRRHDVLRRAGA